MENKTGAPQERSHKGRMQLLIGSLVVLIPTAFFGTRYAIKLIKEKFNKKKHDNSDQTTGDQTDQTTLQTPAHRVPRTGLPARHAGDAFPLDLRSKGTKVRELQQSLIRTYGPAIFPKYGADGIFGSELATFLRSKGYGVPLQETDFKKITQEQKPPTALLTFDPAAIAKGIYGAILVKDYSSAITLLKAIPHPGAYSQVSEKFKALYRVNGVRQTLVNAMLSSFAEKSQKENTKQVFLKMGLKYAAATDKWSLT